MSDITITELEAAINFWRSRMPATGEELSLGKEAAALSRPYALLILQRQSSIPAEQLDGAARAAWLAYKQMNEGLPGR